MSAILTGNPHGPHLQKSEPVWRRGVGWQTRQTWAGTQASIRAFVPTWLVDAESLELDLSGPEGMAYVTYARDAEGNPSETVNPELESETVWELDGNDVVKDLYEHPSMSGESMDEDQLFEIKKQVAKFDSADSTYSVSGITAANRPWFYLLIKGVRQFASVQWVIRKTTTVPRTFHQSVSLVGVDYLWDVNDIPDIPDVLLFDAAQIPEPPHASAYRFSWLKKSPRVMRSTSGRFQMIEEWWLDAWSYSNESTQGLYPIYEP